MLLIEDEEIVREMGVTMLTHLGFAVLESKDGVKAVEVFRLHQHEIRCVLCDLTLPRMDGWETLRALRKLSPHIPVILSAATTRRRLWQANIQNVPMHFWVNLMTFQRLRETINRVLTAPAGNNGQLNTTN